MFLDHRGSLASLKYFEFPPKEILVSFSHKGVFRGFHWSPYQKQIYILEGEINDMWYVPETGEYFNDRLSSGSTILIPENALHGFYALSDTKMVYILQEMFSDKDKSYHWSDPLLPFNLDMSAAIMSQKDKEAPFYHQADFVILGASGFLGSETVNVLENQDVPYLVCPARLEESMAIKEFLVKSNCKYLICAAGISGKPTTAWCETHEKETFEVNYLSMLHLIKVTWDLDIHLTIYGSGLVYPPDNKVYTEDSPPTLTSTVYSNYRIQLEKCVRLYPNVLYLRILYPTALNGHPKCFKEKMMTRIPDAVHVSITVVPELFPLIPKLVEDRVTGILNFVNPGTISLAQFVNAFGKDFPIQKTHGFELSTNKLESYVDRQVTHIDQLFTKSYVDRQMTHIDQLFTK